MSSADSTHPKAVSVLLPLPLAGAYDYLVPTDMTLGIGDFVLVPLGRRELVGTVWAIDAKEQGKTLKPVVRKLDLPPLPPALRRFIDWVAAYNLAPPGAVLRMCFAGVAGTEPPTRFGFALGDLLPTRLTPARQRVIELLQGGPPRSLADLTEAAAVGAAVIQGLVKAGNLRRVPLTTPPGREALIDWRRRGPLLSDAQKTAADDLCTQVGTQKYSCTLLEGVTGSGKTEVYLEAIAATLAAGRQALVLLPEIALSAQWLQRFTARFGAPPAEWHSDLGDAARRRTWRGVANGTVPVVVGARSALFLPFPDLGLIVVDEEHDASFKQEEGVCYHARDMAIVRASLGAFPIVLASATPGLETLANVTAGRYQRLHLPERHGAAKMPAIHVIDMRAAPPPVNNWLSPVLIKSIEATLARSEQVMLFLNRRGYAPLTLCGACGHRLECPHCSAWLVQHRTYARLQCHHCGHRIDTPHECPACQVEGKLKACGPGVERLDEEARRLFPKARIAVMASDTLGGPRAATELVRAMQAEEIDLLIGTQLVAKGHHFPHLTLVGVIDADLGLAGGDLRAGERTLQLLTQVAGRAGRADKPGQVFLQSYMPEHPVLRALAAGNITGFIAAEMSERQAAGMPPFGRLAALIVSGSDLDLVTATARHLIQNAPIGSREIQVFGPAPAPLSRVRNRHRYRLLMKASRQTNVQSVLRRWLADLRLRGDTKLQIDIDPQSFM